MTGKREKIVKGSVSEGSALILAVVLTSLLAIVGVLFVMTARVERISTSAIVENRELNLAIETVVARISEELALDVPGVLKGFEYYDYPDADNAWLASSEPCEGGVGNYYWRQVSNITGTSIPWMNLPAIVVSDYQAPADVGGTLPADADGDGVSDSIWVVLPNMTSSKGGPIFVAVRIVDDGGKLNVNTGFMSDANSDGSSQMQINLMALASLPGEPPPTPAQQTDRQTDLLDARANYGLGLDPSNLYEYERNVVWRYNEPNGIYTPFDISDELEFRYRFLLNQTGIDTRLEELGTLGGKWGFRENAFSTPVDPGQLGEWFVSACATGGLDPNYAYRHITTTHNMDRIIAPGGAIMLNVNRIYDPNDLGLLYQAIQLGLADAGVTDDARAAQTAVNLVDYHDSDSNVTAFDPPDDGTSEYYFGFERPCVYISELIYYEDEENADYKVYYIELYRTDANDERATNWLLTIDKDGDGYEPSEPNVTITWSAENSGQFYWVQTPDPCGKGPTPRGDRSTGANPADGAVNVDPDIVFSWADTNGADSYDVYFGKDFGDVDDASATSYQVDVNNYDPCGAAPLDPGCYYWRVDVTKDSTVTKGNVWSFSTEDANRCPYKGDALFPAGELFTSGSIVELHRPVETSPGVVTYVVVDRVVVPPGLVGSAGTSSYQRDITKHKCIRRLWGDASVHSLGGRLSSDFVHADPEKIQAHPPDASLTNIGEIGSVFCMPLPFTEGATENEVRINLANTSFQRIFNYLTVFDPSSDWINNDGDRLPDGTEIIDEFDYNLDGYPDPGAELKVPGRININTAPWYVIAQLPWMQYTAAGNSYNRAQDVVIDRDLNGPYRSIGEVMRVQAMQDLALDASDNLNSDVVTPGPDFTDDSALNDFEERDSVFARISNLVTVRSDVFTAYILVRIGTDGPQKRAIAILDRSDVYADVTGGAIGKVKVRALHPVHDPR